MGEVLRLSEGLNGMTYRECLAFIERSRRQLDRFDVAIPHPEGHTIDPEEAKAIRAMVDDLEADIHRSLGIA